MTEQEIQTRVNRDSIWLDVIFSLRYKVKPCQSLIYEGWFQKDYQLSTTINGKTIGMLFEFQFHYFEIGVDPAIICLIVDATTPKAVEGESSMLFKCKSYGSDSIIITYNPEKETLAAMQNVNTFNAAIQKICNDIELNLEEGALGYFIREANQ